MDSSMIQLRFVFRRRLDSLSVRDLLRLLSRLLLSFSLSVFFRFLDWLALTGFSSPSESSTTISSGSAMAFSLPLDGYLPCFLSLAAVEAVALLIFLLLVLTLPLAAEDFYCVFGYSTPATTLSLLDSTSLELLSLESFSRSFISSFTSLFSP